MSNAREIAMKVIYDVEFNGAYSNMALKKALKTDMPKQDKAFISNLVYGVTDRKLTLDYVIGKFSKIKLKKISKYILIILRMGIYQIMFMDKVPTSAAVNESVKLARRYGHGASAGFVNGLLRNVSKTEIEYPSDKIEYLSVKYSFPMWLCEKWIDEFGYDFTEKLTADIQKFCIPGERDEILSVKEYVKLHYNENIDLNTAAKLVNISPSHLSSLFKKETGKNFSSYLTEVRMKEAKRLLKNPHAMIYEVAEQTGYANSGYFGKAFKKFYGITPEEYKKNMKKKEDVSKL